MGWDVALAMVVAAEVISVFIYRVMTAGVGGANIGAGMMLICVVPIVALLLAAAYRLTCVLRGRRVVASVPMLVLWLAGIHFVIGIPVPWAAPAFLAGAIAFVGGCVVSPPVRC